MVKLPTHRAYTHPGEILLEEFLKPLDVSQSKFARHIGVNPNVVNELCNGKRAVSVRMAQLLEAALGMEADFWLTIQNKYNLSTSKLKASELPKMLPGAKKSA